MPLPLIAAAATAPTWLPAAAAAATAIGSSIAGNIGSRRRQARADAVNLANWHRQNEYNHPQQQMDRLRQAGLNPNLVYGQGGGSQQVGDVAPSKAAEYKMDAGDPIGKHYQMKRTEAQTDNTRLLLEEISKRIDLLGAQKTNTEADTGVKVQTALNLIPTGTTLTAGAVVADEMAKTQLSLIQHNTKIAEQQQTQAGLQTDILTETKSSIIKIAAQTLQNLRDQGVNIRSESAKRIVEKVILDKTIEALPAGTKPGDSWVNRKVQHIYNETLKWMDKRAVQMNKSELNKRLYKK